MQGLAAFFLTFTLSAHAEFLYKDDVVKNPRFTQQIELIGSELKAKTGVSLYLVMVRDLDDNQTVAQYEEEIASKLKEPAVIMTFVELKQEIDILARPVTLYKDFNKNQVLSPSATFIGSIVNALIFAHSFDNAMELITNRGGTILPILAERAKGDDIVKKYSVGMFNGYTDVAEQIAKQHNVVLTSSAGSESQDFINYLRIVFYGIIIWALFRYVKGRFFRQKKDTKDV